MKRIAAEEQWTSGDNVNIGVRKSLTFNGVPLVLDSHSPGSGSGSTDNWLTALNEDCLGFTINSHENMKLGMLLEPTTQNAKLQKVLFAAALWTDRRDRQGGFQAINPGL